MKNIFTFLGLSLLLTGCFEQPKTEKVNTQATENELVEKQETQMQSVSNSVIEENRKVTNLEIMTNGVAVDNVEKITENTESLIENTKSELVETAQEMNESIKENLEVASQPIIKATKVRNVVNHSQQKNVRKVSKTRTNRKEAYNVNGLSPEEQRVGAQRPLTLDEIKELKYKCRYSMMSEQERKFYNCGLKKVIVN